MKLSIHVKPYAWFDAIATARSAYGIMEVNSIMEVNIP